MPLFRGWKCGWQSPGLKEGLIPNLPISCCPKSIDWCRNLVQALIKSVTSATQYFMMSSLNLNSGALLLTSSHQSVLSFFNLFVDIRTKGWRVFPNTSPVSRDVGSVGKKSLYFFKVETGWEAGQAGREELETVQKKDRPFFDGHLQNPLTLG